MTHAAAVEIAKKLRALAEKASEAGERSTASKKLQEFCVKHGLDADEYVVETIKVSVPYANDQEKSLLSAVMCMVLEVDHVKGIDERGIFTFRCTQRQFDDIADAFSHYKKIYYDYVDGVMSSLITKNRIVNQKPVKPQFKMDDMTDEERKTYEETIRAGQPPRTDQSGSKETPKSVPNQSSAEETACKDRKDDRIRRVFMVMEETPWVKKVRPKLFLR